MWVGSHEVTGKGYVFTKTSQMAKAIANGPVGQVLAGPLFLKVKTKFHFTKSK